MGFDIATLGFYHASMSAEKNDPKHTVPVLRHAVRVLEVIAREGATMTSPQIAKALGISRSSCYRILQTFCAFDWIQPMEGGGFSISFGLLPTVRPLLTWERLARDAQGSIERLAQETQLGAKLSVRQSGYQVTIARAESPKPIAPVGRVGTRFPIFWGSSGAALLSSLPAVELERLVNRANPSVWTDGHTIDVVAARAADCAKSGVCVRKDADLCTVSAPLKNRSGRVLAALTIIGLPGDFTDENVKRYKTAVQKSAKDVSAVLTDFPDLEQE